MFRISHRMQIALALAVLTLSAQARAISPEQHATIVRLGELNGIALQCGQFDETRRMKKALIEGLPKLRALGQMFEEETQKSFLAFIEQRQSCPAAPVLAQQVDAAITALLQAYQTAARSPD